MSAPSEPTRPTPTAWGNTRSGFGERLRTYLIGVGIGAILLGMFWMMKRQAAQNQAAAPVQEGGSAQPSSPPPAAQK